MHLILDGRGCDKTTLDSFELINEVLDKLPEKLGMKKLSAPCLLRGKNPKGITGFVVVEESAIMIHTFPESAFISFDLYSCKDFDADLVIDYVKKAFKIAQTEITKLDRKP